MLHTPPKNTRTLCFQGDLILPDAILKSAFLVVEEGRIKAIETQKPSWFHGPIQEVKEGYVSPGFIDIHVHGGGGADYMDGTTEAVASQNLYHLRHGTTTIFPTTTTGSTAQFESGIVQACMAIRDSWSVRDGSYIGGIHFYGPYFAEAKVGCHSAEGREILFPKKSKHFFSLDVIRVATCAAELLGSEDFIGTPKRRMCLVTCGHSNASWD